MTPELKAKIEAIINKHKIILFMKGDPQAPMCGFSAAACTILRTLGATFHHYNILTDPTIRQGIKEYSSWPTIPQLYINGHFIGGSDIMQELYENGQLAELVSKD